MPFQSSFLFSFLLFLSTGVLSHLLYNPHGRFVQAAIAALNSLQTNAKTLALQRKTGGRDLAKSLADVKNYAKRMAIKVRETNETKCRKAKYYVEHVAVKEARAQGGGGVGDHRLC